MALAGFDDHLDNYGDPAPGADEAELARLERADANGAWVRAKYIERFGQAAHDAVEQAVLLALAAEVHCP